MEDVKPTITRALAAIALAVLIGGCASFARPMVPQTGQSNVVAPAGKKKCSWKMVRSDRRVRRGGILNGILAMSAKDAWTVGAHGAGLSLIQHWNGSKWKLSPSVNPSSTLNALYKVSGSSPSDVWTVGEYSTGKGIMQPLIQHWNGSKWRLSKMLLRNAYGGYLYDVVALGKNDAWAVGGFDIAPGIRQTLAGHWNGKSWSVVKTPNVTSNDNFLTSVAAFGPNDVWAGGGYNNGKAGSSLGFTIHWDGKKWSLVKIDPIKSSYYPVESLAAVPGGTSLFAIGSFDDPKQKRYREYAEQFGKSWNLLNPIGSHYYYYSSGGTFLNGSAAVSVNSVYGVGYYTQDMLLHTFVMAWDGHNWTVNLTPNVSGYNSFFNGASAIPGTKNVWAVGGFSLSATAGPLIEHGERM